MMKNVNDIDDESKQKLLKDQSSGNTQRRRYSINYSEEFRRNSSLSQVLLETNVIESVSSNYDVTDQKSQKIISNVETNEQLNGQKISTDKPQKNISDLMFMIMSLFVVSFLAIFVQYSTVSLKTRRIKYSVVLAVFLQQILSSVVLLIICIITQEKSVIIKGFRWKPLLHFGSINICTTFIYTLCNRMQMHPDMPFFLFKVCQQLRSLTNLLTSVIFFKRKVSSGEVLAMFGVVLSSIIYIFIGQDGAAQTNNSIKLILFSNLVLTIWEIFGVFIESALKKYDHPTIVTLFQYKLSCLLGTPFLFIFEYLETKKAVDLNILNLDRHIWYLIIIEIFRSVFLMYLMKKIDSTAKNMVNSITLLTSFTFGLLFLNEVVDDLLKPFVVVSLTLNILLFSLFRDGNQKLYKLESKLITQNEI